MIESEEPEYLTPLEHEQQVEIDKHKNAIKKIHGHLMWALNQDNLKDALGCVHSALNEIEALKRK